MTGLNHLVLAANNLVAIRSLYENLGFTLTATGQHPFGTGNTIIQLHGTYLELLAITRPQDVVEHSTGTFSFSAFNRDYLQRHEGFAMMVLDSEDAASDIAKWRAKSLQTYAPFEFSRTARMPDGEDVTVGFSLAFVSHPAAPWLGHFACQHYRPEYYAQPQYLSHPNGAYGVKDIWISGGGALELADHFATVTGRLPRSDAPGRIEIATPHGDIVLATVEEFQHAFGVFPPHPQDGPHLAALTIACTSLDRLPTDSMTQVRGRRIVPPSAGFGTAIAFCLRE